MSGKKFLEAGLHLLDEINRATLRLERTRQEAELARAELEFFRDQTMRCLHQAQRDVDDGLAAVDRAIDRADASERQRKLRTPRTFG